MSGKKRAKNWARLKRVKKSSNIKRNNSKHTKAYKLK